MKLRFILITLLFPLFLFGQLDTIYLDNPSFEGEPRKGIQGFNTIDGWKDHGLSQFPMESGPDIHPNGLWEVTREPLDGKTYLGMVTRDTESWETIYQSLDKPLYKGSVYTLELYLAQSSKYMSGTLRSKNEIVNFNTPITLRILGSSKKLQDAEILWTSFAIDHSEWKKYSIDLIPTEDINRLILQAYYEIPTLAPYNGHLLLDHISPIIQIK